MTNRETPEERLLRWAKEECAAREEIARIRSAVEPCERAEPDEPNVGYKGSMPCWAYSDRPEPQWCEPCVARHGGSTAFRSAKARLTRARGGMLSAYRSASAEEDA